jgi:hypothetical protein
MKYRHTSFVLLLLLPLIAARGLLPAGFMLSFDSGRPQLVYCPAFGQSIQGQSVQSPSAHRYAAQDLADVHAAHHQHHHDATSHGTSDHAAHDSSLCPFALAASMAPPSVVPVAVFSGIVIATTPHFSDDFFASRIASNAHPIRGPPALS